MKASVGCIVELYDCVQKETVSYEIVPAYLVYAFIDMKHSPNSYRTEQKSDANGIDKISDQSPLGQRLLNKSEGQRIEFISPDGEKQRYTIQHISKIGVSE